MWRVYSLSYCCGVHFLVCREKTGFFEHSNSPINYCTIVNVSQKRCRWKACGRACARVWLLHWLFGMFVKWWNAAWHAVFTCRQSWIDSNKKKTKLMTLIFKERSSFLIWGAPPRVFNRFLDFQGSCSVNYPRVKSRVGIKMWAQCQMHSYRLKCHNTWLPSLSCVPASSGGIDGKNQIEKEEKSPFGQHTWHKFWLFQLTHPAVFHKLRRGTS